MKGWIAGLLGLLGLVSVQQPTLAYWEEFTDYREEPVYGWVQVPTTHTVDVPDYGWVNQGNAVPRTTISTRGAVVVTSISKQTLLDLQSSATKNPVAVKKGAYSGNLSDRATGVALTGLKGREVVEANKAVVSAPRSVGQGNSGGTIVGRDPERRSGRDRQERDDDRDDDRGRDRNRDRD